MRDHIKLLGILNIVWSSISLLVAMFALVLFGGLAGVAGLASRDGSSDGFLAAPILAVVGMCIVALISAISLPALIGGIGLIKLQPWSRVLMIVVSVFHLISFPFGTALGVYGLWVLLHEQARREFGGQLGAYVPPIPPSGAGTFLK
jgi:hypothetical protein